MRHYDDELTKSLGVKIIAVDQPGVGKSTNVKNLRNDRTLFNYAKDIEELVNFLNIDKFAVAGHSGGGPHALAIAHYIGPTRVVNGVLAAPAPPLDEVMIPGIFETFNFPYAKYIFQFCQYIPFLIYLLCYPIAWWANYDMLNGYIKSVADNDRTTGNPETFFGHPKQTQIFYDSFTQGFTQGPAGIQGMFHIALLNRNGWGFDIRGRDNNIPQHFDIFMSDVDIVMKPELGQKMCETMSDATLHIWQNAGHYSFVDRECWIEFYTTLVKEYNRVREKTTTTKGSDKKEN